MSLIGFVLGVLIVAATVTSVFTTLVLPRTTSSRLLRWISQSIARVAVPVIRQLRTFEAKDRLMTVVGPLAMILMFVIWLLSLVVGFGLISWWLQGGSLGRALEVSGSSVFTLGVSSGPQGTTQTLEFVAAGIGLLVVALEIAYLPTLYNAFSARETEVTLLATRAGVPAWGPEILARAHLFGSEDQLPALYDTWERWAAAVAENHTNYPTLLWFRSPVATRSWLLALVAMMDAAALQNALDPSTAPIQSRLFLAMGVDCLRALARTLRIDYDQDPRPTGELRLQRSEFETGLDRLQSVGYQTERDSHEAWRHFRGWRVNYEGIADSLTRVIMPPPAPWLLERPSLGTPVWPRVVDRTPDRPDAGAV